jgi:predicted dehydrogenase
MVCSLSVDKRFLTVKPSIIAVKAIFIEWLLDCNLYVEHKMASLAAKYNVKTIVGTQGSFSPRTVRKMKEMVEEGTVGKL